MQFTMLPTNDNQRRVSDRSEAVAWLIGQGFIASPGRFGNRWIRDDGATIMRAYVTEHQDDPSAYITLATIPKA